MVKVRKGAEKKKKEEVPTRKMSGDDHRRRELERNKRGKVTKKLRKEAEKIGRYRMGLVF